MVPGASTMAVGRLWEIRHSGSGVPALENMWARLSSPQSTARLEKVANPLRAAGRQVPTTPSARIR